MRALAPITGGSPPDDQGGTTISHAKVIEQLLDADSWQAELRLSLVTSV